MTQEEFASHLGVSVRTIAAWRASPEMVPQNETQRILDTAHERAGEDVRRRFIHLSRLAAGPPQAQALRVAIAIVMRGSDVLLVCRQDGSDIAWQFPAGIVKPGASAQKVAVRETLSETGIVCSIRRHLGERLHPITHAFCDYYQCEYVHGEAINGDTTENVAVAWVPIRELPRYIPTDRIFPPILEALEAAA
jgi:8-oxo-dGTP pyrophosphatase MutT (NUDIX family)